MDQTYDPSRDHVPYNHVPRWQLARARNNKVPLVLVYRSVHTISLIRGILTIAVY